jgi:uroporphyrinogen-III decarboxylase
MAQVKKFADERKVLVQGWSAFGMDGIAWLCGVEGAVMAAMENPSFFQDLVDMVYDFDRRRTEIMLDVGGVDMVVQRGWYSSTPFWSPTLFRRFVLPHLKDLVNITHQAGALFAYVMTTGLMAMLDELKEAGIDLLYFVDPVQDNIDLKVFKQRLEGKFAVVGGINSGVTLGRGKPAEIREAVYSATHDLAEGGGFILSPVDALFPDTPLDSVKIMIEAWREVCDYPI